MLYLEHLKTANESVSLLSSADRLYNLSSLVDDLYTQGEEVWNYFNASPKEQLWFYESFYATVAEKIPETLRQELRVKLQELAEFIV